MAIKRIEKDDLIAKKPLDNLTQGAKEAEASIKMLETAMKAVVGLAEQTKKQISLINPKDVKGIKELNKLNLRANDLSKSKVQLNKQLNAARDEEVKGKLRLQKANAEQRKALKDEIALENKQIGTLEKLQVENRQLRREREKLNLETAEGTARLRQINAQLDKNNLTIDKSSDKMKKQRLGIGRYKQAVQGLRGALAQLGLAFGVFNILRDSFNIVKDFEQSQADLASVLGINVNEMKALSDQAKELGSTTTFTASQVAELQKEFAKLGFTEREILNTTEATLLLAEATGTDLARAAEVTGSTLRGFGLDASETQRVVDVMAKSFSSSSLDMEKFATAMASVAPVAKQSGFSIEQTTALLGTLTDRGIDASTAGTGLRNMFLLSGKAGLTLDEALEQINNSSDKTGESLKLFGQRGATLGVILAENGQSVENLTDKLNDADKAAEKMAETQRSTLGGALKLLTSAWEGFILKMNEAGGASDKLRRVVVFLADNLETILSTIGKLTKAFIIYKGVMFSLKMADRVKEFVNFGKAVKSGDKNIKDATTNVKKFGRAITAIGWTALISFVVSLATAFYDVASGATEARIAAEALDRQAQKTNEIVGKEISERQRQLETFKGTREEREALIKTLKAENAQQQKNLKQNIESRLEWQKSTKAYLDANSFFLDAAQTARESGFGSTLSKEQEELLALSDAYAESRAKTLAYRDGISLLKREFKDSPELITETSNSVNNLTNSVNKATKATERFNSATLDRGNGTETDDGLADRIAEIEAETFAKEMQIADIKVLNAELEGNEEAILNAKIERIQKRVELETKYLKEGTAERVKLEKEAELEIKNLRESGVNDLKEVEENKLGIQKEFIDLATDYFIKRADERIAKIQEEIDAATKQSDYYKQLAAEGNISAKESLAEQNQIIAEANAKKKQEEERKQRILLVSSVLQAFNSNLEQGDTSGEALTKAITSTALISQFVSALPAFEEGTENTSLHGKGKNIDGRGGFHAVLHQNERVLTSGQNDMIGDYSNNEVASIMQQHRLGELTDGAQVMVGFGSELLVNEMLNLKDEMSSVRKAIQDKPVPNIEMGEITQNYITMTKRTVSGKGVTTSKFKVD